MKRTPETNFAPRNYVPTLSELQTGCRVVRTKGADGRLRDSIQTLPMRALKSSSEPTAVWRR